VRKLKIGYWPLSQNLKSAGDRRRLIFWAQARGHTVVTDLSQKVDVILASENSDFNSLYFVKNHAPVVFDLVDAYLSPLNTFDDLARGLGKKFSGQISGDIKPFSHHVKDFCQRASGVICSSVEQEQIIREYNANTHVILDSHTEIPFLTPKLATNQSIHRSQILWEGQPATIRGVGKISSSLTKLSKSYPLDFNFVTDESYFQYLGKYIRRSTFALLKNDLRAVSDQITIIPWTPSNLIKSAERSNLAMIPIDLAVPMQNLKPENRLLIMWRLGLPCLTSPSPAYIRVAQKAGGQVICRTPQDWEENFNRLLSEPTLAHREVLLGQNYLNENHNERILLHKWDAAIESVIG
jgi:hypothetical protein